MATEKYFIAISLTRFRGSRFGNQRMQLVSGCLKMLQIAIAIGETPHLAVVPCAKSIPNKAKNGLNIAVLVTFWRDGLAEIGETVALGYATSGCALFPPESLHQ